MAENNFQHLFIYLHKIDLHCFVMTQPKVFPNHYKKNSLKIDLQLERRLKWPSITMILGNGFWVQLDGN